MTTIRTKSKSNTQSGLSTESADTNEDVALAPPPANASIPVVPSGTTVVNGRRFAGTAPRAVELASLANAIADLNRFTTYHQTLGSTAPDYAQVLQSFVVANQWSEMRVQTTAWDRYCIGQEGIGWTSMRAHMDRLRPAFDLAVAGDPTIATRFPGLAAFLGAKKAIAKQGASTRTANKLAKAKGEPAFHGKVGAKRKRAAEKAALAAPAAEPSVNATATPAASTSHA